MQLGNLATAELQPLLGTLEADFYATSAHELTDDLATMG